MRLWTPLLQGFTSDQMRLAEENTALIEQREKEIQSIVQSISELNEIFRDLATMIVEQVRQTRLTVFSRNKLSQVSQNTSAFYENWLSNCAYAVLYFVLYIVLFIPTVLTEWKGQMEQQFVNFFSLPLFWYFASCRNICKVMQHLLYHHLLPTSLYLIS